MKRKPNRVAIVSEQCDRGHMEDTHTFDLNFIRQGWIFGGVYDGHGERRPADVAAEKMPLVYKDFIERGQSETEAFVSAYKKVSGDMTWAQECGACAANFFIKGKVIHYANAGDSQIVIVGKELTELTTNHRVSNEAEEKYVINHGGHIEGQYVGCDSRYIMMTRVLGDQPFKSVGVRSEPSVGSYTIKSTDRFLVAGTDGLFDFIHFDEIQRISQSIKSARGFARELSFWQMSIEESDNLTIIVLEL